MTALISFCWLCKAFHYNVVLFLFFLTQVYIFDCPGIVSFIPINKLDRVNLYKTEVQDGRVYVKLMKMLYFIPALYKMSIHVSINICKLLFF